MATHSLPAGLALACPHCRSGLTETFDNLTCPGCGRVWPHRGGAADFGEAPVYPQDFTPEQIASLVNTAEAEGWQVALHDHMRPLDLGRYRHAVDEYRAQWRCLLPAHPQARVLDFRCGWGPVSTSLAEDYGLVVAADTSAALARFTALRARQSGARNVFALSLDPSQRLPFADGFFDGVVLQSALEWGEAEVILREVARVLAPQGWVFANVANQLNAARLLQALQPARNRRHAEATLRRPRPRTLGGYQQALARTGLRARAVYAILPSVSEPFYIVPAGSRGALRFFLDNLFNDASLHLALAERRLLAPYHLARALWQALRLMPLEPALRHLMPGYALFAVR